MSVAKERRERSGIMLYFETIPVLEQLTDAQRGRLLYSALLFAKDGIEPTFDERELSLVWPLLSCRIRSDDERYKEKCKENSLRRKYGLYKLSCERKGDAFLTFEEWKEAKQTFTTDNSP